MVFHFSCISFWKVVASFLRSSQSFNITPPKLLEGLVIWNICWYSDSLLDIWNIWSAYVCIWLTVALGGPEACINTIPWSSVGANSDFEVVYKYTTPTSNKAPITIMTCHVERMLLNLRL